MGVIQTVSRAFREIVAPDSPSAFRKVLAQSSQDFAPFMWFQRECRSSERLTESRSKHACPEQAAVFKGKPRVCYVRVLRGELLSSSGRKVGAQGLGTLNVALAGRTGGWAFAKNMRLSTPLG